MLDALPKNGALSGNEIRALLSSEQPLVVGLRDVDAQIQPNGIDLTLADVWRLTTRGQVAVQDGERVLSERVEVPPGDSGCFGLDPGAYIARLNEAVHLPRDLMAFGRPRSSLLRCGVAVHTAVWDAGYGGRSEALMVVYNPAGFAVHRNARILQLVFFRLSELTAPYRGAFQGENLG